MKNSTENGAAMSAARSISEDFSPVRHPRQIDTQRADFSRFRQLYDAGPEVPWERDVIDKLNAILQLPRGWDSYDALPVNWGAAMFGLTALRTAMHSRTPTPSVVPTPEGAVQFEWHHSDLDIEFVVTNPYDAELWFHDERGYHADVSTPISQEFDALSEAVSKLSDR